MTKEELIALSDLNREDNIKYISSEAQWIAIALDSDRYAPALCKLERAYICGRRKSENYIADLEKENADLKMGLKWDVDNRDELLKENAELKKVAEFQQSSNMSRHFENKKLKEVLAVGSTFNKALNSMNKSLEEERDKYRNMVFDKDEQLTKAKEIIKELLNLPFASDEEVFANVSEILGRAEQFLKEAKK